MFKRIQKHFDERLTPEQQREQRYASGIRNSVTLVKNPAPSFR